MFLYECCSLSQVLLHHDSRSVIERILTPVRRWFVRVNSRIVGAAPPRLNQEKSQRRMMTTFSEGKGQESFRTALSSDDLSRRVRRSWWKLLWLLCCTPDQGYICMIMEYMDGGTVQHLSSQGLVDLQGWPTQFVWTILEME
mgnify:CR=1 FL=1